MDKLQNNILLVLLNLIISACVQNGEFGEPPSFCVDNELIPNISFAEVKQLYKGEIIQIQEELVIEAYVNSSDASGNIFGSVFIQNSPENPTDGLQMDLDLRQSHLFFEIGQRVLINLRGLYLDGRNDVFRLGGTFRNAGGGLSVGRLPSNLVNDHFFVSCEEAVVLQPSSVTLNELNDNQIGTLINIQNLQLNAASICEPFAVAGENTDRVLEDCEKNQILMRNSGFSDFQASILPLENGSITGVLTKFRDDYRLIIRDENDIDFSSERCEGFTYSCELEEIATSIKTIKQRYLGSSLRIRENIRLKLTVSSDNASMNIATTNLYGQDDSGGILLEFNQAHNLNTGDIIEIGLLNTTLNSMDGLFQISGISLDRLISVVPDNEVMPQPITKSELRNDDLLGTLIELDNLQFKNVPLFYEGVHLLTDCDFEIETRIDQEAVFAREMVDEGRGIITGILIKNDNNPQLHIRNTSDINFKMTRELCSISTSEEVFFSEFADPNNDTGGRFIELFNAGDIRVDLSGWEIRRYTNAGIEISSRIDLSEIEIEAGQALVIAANTAEFERIYGFVPDISGTSNGPAGSNGDDNFELVDASGKIIDVFGIIGEDGSGTNHEFEDGRAVRNFDVIKGNPIYIFSEWTIYNDTGGAGTINQPQDAPEAFSPGSHKQ